METETYPVVRAADREKAPWLTDFDFPWLDREAPRTRFRAWHDGTWFHFEFRVEDPDLVLDESPEDDDKVLGSDRVELFLSPTRDLSRAYFGLEMDPRGLVYDYRAEFHRKFDSSWEMTGLTFRGEITEDGYRVEGRMSLVDLREMGCLRGDRMVTGIYRAEFGHLPGGEVEQNWISWVNPGTSVPDFHIPETFGLLIFEGLAD